VILCQVQSASLLTEVSIGFYCSYSSAFKEMYLDWEKMISR